MRTKLVAIAAMAGALGMPLAAQAQTVGIVRGESVIVDDDAGIAVDQRPAFREYIVREHVPSYTVPDRVIVGGVLPEYGVTYYDVPQTFGASPYRYTGPGAAQADVREQGPDERPRTRFFPTGAGLFLCWARVPDAVQRYFSGAPQSRDPFAGEAWTPAQQRNTACCAASGERTLSPVSSKNPQPRASPRGFR